MSLENWLRSGRLTQEDGSLAEIQKLLRVVDRELSDAKVTGLSPDGSFQHAYEAALQLCLLALRAAGYRPAKGGGHHALAVESLRFTLGQAWNETADYLSRCSHQRNQLVYDRVDVVTEEDAADLIEAAEQLYQDVIDWLRTNHAPLLPPGL